MPQPVLHAYGRTSRCGSPRSIASSGWALATIAALSSIHITHTSCCLPAMALSASYCHRPVLGPHMKTVGMRVVESEVTNTHQR